MLHPVEKVTVNDALPLEATHPASRSWLWSRVLEARNAPEY